MVNSLYTIFMISMICHQIIGTMVSYNRTQNEDEYLLTRIYYFHDQFIKCVLLNVIL